MTFPKIYLEISWSCFFFNFFFHGSGRFWTGGIRSSFFNIFYYCIIYYFALINYHIRSNMYMFLLKFCCLATVAREHSYRSWGPYIQIFEEVPLFSIQSCISNKSFCSYCTNRKMLIKQNPDLHIIMISKEKFNQNYGWLNFISNIFEFSKTVIVKTFSKIKGKQGKTWKQLFDDVNIFYVYYKNLIRIWHKDGPD